MSRSLKILGLTVVAGLALSAMAASGASAEAFRFKSESGVTTITGKQHAGGNGVITTDTGTISCNEVTYIGTQVGSEVTELTLTPSYSGCSAFGFLNVPIDVNGCRYRLTVDTKINGNYEGKADFVCDSGKQVEVTAPGCTVTFKSQNGLGLVTFTNVGAGSTKETTFDFNLTGRQYEEHRPLFGICATNTVLTNNGTYVTAGLLTGSSGSHTGISVG